MIFKIHVNNVQCNNQQPFILFCVNFTQIDLEFGDITNYICVYVTQIMSLLTSDYTRNQ